MEPNIIVEKKFKSFNETYKLCAFSLAIGLIYPNKKNVKKRFFITVFIISLNYLELYWLTVYLFKCIYKMDIYNFTRTATISIISTLFLFKTIYAIYKTNEFCPVLDEISEDLLRGNYLDEDLQDIYNHYIKRAKIGQFCWFTIPLLLGTQFTVYSAVCMIYEYMNTDQWNKHMVHQVDLHHLEDKQYKSPYFEIIFGYNCIESLILAPNFSGFDGSFCIATAHLSLKLDIITLKIKKAFIDAKTRYELRDKIKAVIKEHQIALNFYKKMKNLYETWLFVVFLLTSLLISFNIYQVYLVKRVEPKYLIFAFCAGLHMYMPCHYASNLSKVNEKLCAQIYSVPWETWADPVSTKYLIFMMANTQRPLEFKGSGIIVYNMKLFVSIMHTSYTFFTLISSGR